MRLQDLVDGWDDHEWTGGPREQFEAIGRLQLITMLRCGLEPDHTVLDVGCGALRGGYWLIRFLEPDRYCGIDPSRERVRLGVERVLGPELVEQKRPRFSHADDFRFDGFGERFDAVLARSVWTHASKAQIRTMLEQFDAVGTDTAWFLTSYLPARAETDDYQADDWVGRSHESDEEGLVRHSLAWIQAAAAPLGLEVGELAVDRVNQRWLLITRAGQLRPEDGPLADLLEAPQAPPQTVGEPAEGGGVHAVRRLVRALRR